MSIVEEGNSLTGDKAPRLRVLLLGATGTIGQATARALTDAGHEVTCFVRSGRGQDGGSSREEIARRLPGARLRFGDVCSATSLRDEAFSHARFDALVSCLASRTGAPADAWAIDYGAHHEALAVAKEAGVAQMVLLSAICVQKPLLAFQKAKLAFEEELVASGLRYSIVRPTAFFKSLSGQVERVRAGKPFLLFGDGKLTSCKPISDADLAEYIAGCLTDQERWNRILPIGGPGPAITPKEQGEALFELLDQTPRYRHVPLAFMNGICAVLGLLGKLSPQLAGKAELARIGRYYATESMLVLDPETGLYDAEATPSTGTETLLEYYGKLARGEVEANLGDHAVF